MLEPPRLVSFDLMAGDVYFVLTEALGDFAARMRAAAGDEQAAAGLRKRLRGWAECADAALSQIEASLLAPSGGEDADLGLRAWLAGQSRHRELADIRWDLVDVESAFRAGYEHALRPQPADLDDRAGGGR